MFGFLNPRPHSREYRRVYARLCQHQHVHYGLRSLAFHSYEAVFLYQCAIDAGAVNVSTLPDQRCCKLRTRGPIRQAPDAAVGRFCASLALLLAAIKLEDDLRDSPGLLARASRWLLRGRIALAKTYFARLDRRFRGNVDRLLADHQAFEQRGGAIPLDEYAEPTALAFGYVFGLMAKLGGLLDCRETLTALGRKLGSAIIAFDCAVDWKRDRQRGEFNPLTGEEEVRQALLLSAAELSAAAGIARHAFGATSSAARTLDAVRQRMMRCNPLLGPGNCEAPPVGVWTRIKRLLRQSFRVARQAAAVPVLMAASGDGEVEEPRAPEDDSNRHDRENEPNQEERDKHKATASNANGCNDCGCLLCNCNGCGGSSGDACIGNSCDGCAGDSCNGCDACSGCDCNC